MKRRGDGLRLILALMPEKPEERIDLWAWMNTRNPYFRVVLHRKDHPVSPARLAAQVEIVDEKHPACRPTDLEFRARTLLRLGMTTQGARDHLVARGVVHKNKGRGYVRRLADSARYKALLIDELRSLGPFSRGFARAQLIGPVEMIRSCEAILRACRAMSR